MIVLKITTVGLFILLWLYKTFIDIKFNPLSVASALACSVLEHPGGPYNSTPRGASIPSRVKAPGFFNGHSTACFNFFFTISFPPMSDQYT